MGSTSPWTKAHFGSIMLSCIIGTLLTATSHAGSICGCEHRYDLLMEFYTATSGPQWTNRAGWGTLTPCSTDWYGVTCDSGDITEVLLDRNGLNGTLPASWSSMSSLMYLFLEGNRLSGTLPAPWSSMSKLIFLHLDANNLSGTLPVSWSSMISLQGLSLYSNSISGTLPASWSTLSSLQALSLNSNSFTGTLPVSWSSMASLQTLSLYSNHLNGTLPESWSSLSSLQTLSLYNNYLSGPLPPSWATMSSLQTLSLDSNSLSGTLPESWSSMTSLQRLSLDSNSLSGTLPASWSSLSSLQRLSLDSNSLSGTLPESWSSVPRLQSLSLSSNRFSGTVPESWSSMPSLQALSLDRNSLSGTLHVSWSSMSRLQSLSLFSNSLSGTLPASWSTMASLMFLYLFRNRLSGVLPASWSSMSSLMYLYLYTNSLSGTLPASWSSMSSLMYLHLFSNSLSGTLPASWSSMPSLQNLSLYSNHLNGTLPASWESMTSLRILELHQNCLVGSVPTTYANLTLLQSMNLCNTNVTGGYHLASCNGVSNAWPLYCTARLAMPSQTASRVVAATATRSREEVSPSKAGTTSHSIVAMSQELVVVQQVEPSLPALAAASGWAVGTTSIAASAVVVLSGGAVALIDMQILAAMGSNACAPPALRQASSSSRFLLSPFYALGDEASVLGNVGLFALGLCVHWAVVVCFRMQRAEGGAPRRPDVRFHFPNHSYTLGVLLIQGVVHAGVRLLCSGEALGTVVGVVAAAAVACGVVARIRIVRSDRLKRFRFSRYRQHTLDAFPAPWALPLGRWEPGELRATHGQMRGTVRGGCEWLSAYPIVCGMAVNAVAAIPVPTSLCIGLWAVLAAILLCAAAVVGWTRPGRAPLSDILQCVGFSVAAALLLVNGIVALTGGGASGASPSLSSAIAALSLFGGLVSCCKAITALVVWWWERRRHGVRVVRKTKDESDMSTLFEQTPAPMCQPAVLTGVRLDPCAEDRCAERGDGDINGRGADYCDANVLACRLAVTEPQLENLRALIEILCQQHPSGHSYLV